MALQCVNAYMCAFGYFGYGYCLPEMSINIFNGIRCVFGIIYLGVIYKVGVL